MYELIPWEWAFDSVREGVVRGTGGIWFAVRRSEILVAGDAGDFLPEEVAAQPERQVSWCQLERRRRQLHTV